MTATANKNPNAPPPPSLLYANAEAHPVGLQHTTLNAYNTSIKQDKQQPDAQNNGGPNEAETSYITTKQTKKRRKKKRNPRTQPHN
jgi:hypothetical protein